ncbi:MAG: DUF5020 family protein [Puniceicoccaceae bacterium]
MTQRTALIALTFVTFCTVSAQNLQLHYDFEREHPTSTFEMFKPDDWGSTFLFIDFDYDAEVKSAYGEFAREFRLGDSGFAAHIEYNGGLTNEFSFGNAYLAGIAYNWLAEDFNSGVSFQVMYKHITQTPTDEPHNFQLTLVWFVNFLQGKMTFSGFADFWKEDLFFGKSYVFLAEPQLWYNVNSHFSIGTEIELSNNFGGIEGFEIRPTAAVKWTF